jgi:hypothetical protein
MKLMKMYGSVLSCTSFFCVSVGQETGGTNERRDRHVSRERSNGKHTETLTRRPTPEIWKENSRLRKISFLQLGSQAAPKHIQTTSFHKTFSFLYNSRRSTTCGNEVSKTNQHRITVLPIHNSPWRREPNGRKITTCFFFKTETFITYSTGMWNSNSVGLADEEMARGISN